MHFLWEKNGFCWYALFRIENTLTHFLDYHHKAYFFALSLLKLLYSHLISRKFKSCYPFSFISTVLRLRIISRYREMLLTLFTPHELVTVPMYWLSRERSYHVTILEILFIAFFRKLTCIESRVSYFLLDWDLSPVRSVTAILLRRNFINFALSKIRFIEFITHVWAESNLSARLNFKINQLFLLNWVSAWNILTNRI